MNGNGLCPRDEAVLAGRAPDEIPAALPTELGGVPVVDYASGVPRGMSARAKVAIGLGVAGLSVVVGSVVYTATRVTVYRTVGDVAPASVGWSQQPVTVSPIATQPAQEESGEDP
jgi:hypothetical protein